MKSVLCLLALFVLMSVVLAGHSGIQVKIPLPLIKIRFVDIAQLFGKHGGHGGGHGGFGLEVGHGGHHGW